MSELIRAATKVADWCEAQAARDKADANTGRLTLRTFDAENYRNCRAMARALRRAIKKERAKVSATLAEKQPD